MKSLFSILCILSLSFLSGQGPDIEWQICLGGAENEYARSIQQTNDGGYIVAGYTSSFDGDVTGNHGLIDSWIVKLDAVGALIWQKCLGGKSNDFAASIQQTSDGGYIMAGPTSSTDGDVSGNHGGGDFWVVKLNPEGNLDWQKCLGGTSFEEPASIQQTFDGGYIVAGTTGSNDGDVSGNHGGSGGDSWIVKLDADGELVWQKCLGGTSADQAFSIQQTFDGGFIMAGKASSNDGDVSGNNGSSDAWVVKLNSDGEIIWQKCLGGTLSEGAWSVQQTYDGGYIMAGLTDSNDGDVTGNHGQYDSWIVKLDADGDLVWQKSLGGTWYDVANSIQRTSDGGYLMAGYTSSNDGDVSGNHTDEEFYDAWIVKLDADGELNWQKCLGGTSDDYGSSIQQTSEGGYIMVGYTSSNDGDVSGNHGGIDFWVVKLSQVVGIDENNDPRFSIFPNPVSEKFTLTSETVSMGQPYAILDQLGKVLLSGEITSASMDFDISSFASGVYYLAVENSNSSIEIVKQ